jgi:hypothetical protein
MKSKLILLSTLLVAILFLSFKSNYEIGLCYVTFNTATNLTMSSADKLTQSTVIIKRVLTDSGEVDVTRADGYRILYKNNKNAPFVNLKVELSGYGSYEKDQKNLLSNLKYKNYNTPMMETQDLIELEYNGYKIYGISRATIQPDGILGTFLMFPGNGITVYFYFNNMKPELRNFESVDDYKKQRNKFIEEYTKHLTKCK